MGAMEKAAYLVGGDNRGYDTIVCSEKGIELLEKSLRASPG